MKTKQLLTILCVCFSINLHSQEGTIIYTDFEPDSVIRIPYYAFHTDKYLDVNKDNIGDFRFNYDSYGIVCPLIEGSMSANSVVDEFVIYPTESFLPNDTIPFFLLNDTIPFINSKWLTYYETCLDTGEEHDYNIGFRNDLGDGNWCYGWLRIRLSVLEGVYNVFATFYDMAYCTVPNYPLRIGQKVIDDLATDEITESKDYVLFPSPANDKITLKFDNDNIGKEVFIYGIDGRRLKTLNSDFDNIDVSDLASGIYVMKIHLDNGNTFTEKFVKE